jgi:hypothetical protein
MQGLSVLLYCFGDSNRLPFTTQLLPLVLVSMLSQSATAVPVLW